MKCSVSWCLLSINEEDFCYLHAEQWKKQAIFLTKDQIGSLSERIYTPKGLHLSCRAPNCIKQAHGAHCLCPQHYIQVKRHGRTFPDRLIRKGCLVPDCLRSHSSHGYCEFHWRRIKKGNSPVAPILKKPREKHLCTVPDCGSYTFSKYCHKHAWRLHRYGSPSLPARKTQADAPCQIPGCNRSAKTLHLCHTHYEYRRRHLKREVIYRQTVIKEAEDGRRLCKVPYCVKPIHGNNLCDRHYRRRKKNQSLSAPSGSISLYQAYAAEEAILFFGKENVSINNRQLLRNDLTNRPLELDLVIFYHQIPTLAFEINGPSHYLPIHGWHILEQQKERDKIKQKQCISLGIRLETIIIDSATRLPVLGDLSRFPIEGDLPREKEQED